MGKQIKFTVNNVGAQTGGNWAKSPKRQHWSEFINCIIDSTFIRKG